MWVEIGLGVAIPATGVAFTVIRYFWKKEKCFIEMKNKIDELSKHDEGSVEEHSGYEERLKMLENDSIEIKIYLQQILKKLDIPFK